MTITKIEQAKKNENRVNIYLNDKFWVGLDKSELLSFGLFKNKEINEEEKSTIEKSASFTKLIGRIISYINIRPHSAKEISDHFIYKKSEESENVTKAIEYLKDKDLISDKRFAEWFTENRFASKRYGINKIKAQLSQKGVDTNIIKEVLSDEKYKDEDFKEEQAVNLEEQVNKALRMIKYKDNNDLKQKLFRRLAGKGFGFDEINKAFKKVAST
jgi:regulatory protein